jgi:lipopolysaccharide transport system ATP-binding protein
MSDRVIKAENLSKLYHLGIVGTGTLTHDLNRWWKMNINGQPDPYAKVGETNDRAHKGKSEFVWALNDINFQVKHGEVLGIIGRNGAGKSTLLKILSKVTSPSIGSVKIKGRIASLLEVGTGFHPELTGRENVYMNGTIMGMNKREIDLKFDEIVDFAGVERYIDSPVKRYSSGMMVRLGFAIAAHLEPEILIVDEVLAVGDAEFQKKCLGKMNNISKKDGRTVLFVSHNMSSIASLCKRGMVFADGKLVYNGLIDKAIEHYYESQKHFDNKIDLKKNQNKIIQLSAIRIYNSLNIETNRLWFQENFHIELEIEGNLKRAVIGILFGNKMIQQICRAYTYESSNDIINIVGRRVIDCNFINLPLVPGKYFIHIWIGSGAEPIEFLENIMEINIIDNDFFQTGKILNPIVPCYVNHTWKLSRDNS